MAHKSMKGIPSMIEIMILKLSTMQITQDEFFDFLKSEQARLKGVIETVNGVVESKDAPPEAKEAVASEVSTGIMGLEFLIDAAKYLEQYRDIPSKSILETGMIMAKRGQELLNIAMEKTLSGAEETFDNFKAISSASPQDSMFSAGIFGGGMISRY